MTVPGPRSGTTVCGRPSASATASASPWTTGRTTGIQESAWSSGSCCHRSTTRWSSRSVAVTHPSVATKDGEEPQHLDVQPDQRDDEAVGEQPGVLLRHARADRLLDVVEVDGQRVRG